MAIEFPQAALADMLAAELARYEIAQELGEWVARDAAVDEVVRAADHDSLVRKIAANCDHLDLADRPRINGVPVLVAEVISEGDTHEWFAIDAAGRRYINNHVHATHDEALMALNNRYDG